MKFGRRLLLVGSVVTLIAVSGGYTIRNSFKAEPLIGYVNNFPSEDNQWIATLEEVDNGLGFGQGMLYDEIHIHHPGEVIADHGENDRSAIFYANSMGRQSDERPQIQWIDSTHLLITYSPSRIEGGMPGKALKLYGGIHVSYLHAQ